MSGEQPTLRFDDRVVVVTGAGGNPGLGRSYAQLLARRGARVVVNDLGVGPDGRGTYAASAETIAAEIRAEGGEAIADTHSVATEDGAKGVVGTALDAWGRVDVLINNAGVFRVGEFDRLPSDAISALVDVHLMGTIWMCRAVWPHMREAGYGRIVNTTSGAMTGAGYSSVYGAAKAGVWSLTRTLALEGHRHGIVVNALAPGATTGSVRVAPGTPAPPETGHPAPPEIGTPEMVAPAAAYLAHESCPCSGAGIHSESGRVWESYFAQTEGWGDPGMTVEDLAAHWHRVVDRKQSRDYGDPVRDGFWPGGPPEDSR